MKIVILSTKEFNMLDVDFKEHTLSDAETTTLCDLLGRMEKEVQHIKSVMSDVLEEDLK